MRVYSRIALRWSGPHVCCGREKLVNIVQDERYATMWRVRYPDGELSDMVNLTRAKDAAMGIATSILNARAKETAAVAATAILMA